VLATLENLSRFHREHEKYYSEAPLYDAAALQRTSRTLKALAERWSERPPATPSLGSPFAGATDLNDERAIEAGGVLFMESGEIPAEIIRIKAELEASAAGAEGSGTWLGSAMEAAWQVAEGLLQFPELADLLGERHSIIANDWQNASMMLLIARQLRRANSVLDRIDFTTAALRADLAGPAHSPRYLFSATELIDQAADLTTTSAMLVHQNERKWRVFHERVSELVAAAEPARDDGDGQGGPRAG
jgi:hypothetical protein